MQTIHLRATVDDDGHLRLDLAAGLPPGPVDVVVVVQPNATERSLRELRGLGAEIWQGIDPDAYVQKLRDEWDQ
jgi:hypothetical protein